MFLTRAEIIELTGYRMPSRQARWLREQLHIEAPRRADGVPVVSRAQVEAALSGQRGDTAMAGPRWSKLPA